jgi:seryl-tRNA synthetase
MIDPKLLRDDIDDVQANLARRNFNLPVQELSSLEDQRKDLQVKVEQLQNRRNVLSKEIGEKKRAGQNADNLLKEVGSLGDDLNLADKKLEEIQNKLTAQYLNIPNLLDPSVPDGVDEQDNKEVRTWGQIPKFDFKVRDHVDLGARDHMIDMEAGAKLAGARFAVLRSGVARMQRALAQFMLDVQTQEHGYQECSVPYLVKLKCFEGTAQLPKFREDFFYSCGQAHDFGLISTAEIPLANLAADNIFNIEELPVKLTAHTPCFRSEAGSYGKDTRGLIRMHQFEKVELVQVTHPEQSMEALEQIVLDAEKILQLLKLPYRVMLLCAGDTGFAAAKTYDLEVWIPSQNTYREISSCSNCKDFQARRMKARFKDPATGKNLLVHTLNGSGLALSRTLVAILENYQQADGSIKVPEVLQQYMGGVTVI